MFLSYLYYMSHFTYSINRTIGAHLKAHPETFIYSCMLVGMGLGLTMFGGLGYALLHPFHQETTGLYLGLGLYSWSFISNMPAVVASTDAKIQRLKDMNKVPF